MKKDKVAKATTDRRTYKVLTTIDQDPYPYSEECWSTHGRSTFASKPGSKNEFSWKRKKMYKFQYRMYRTWKYNRKKQWKEK
jgi:hypothetical protein